MSGSETGLPAEPTPGDPSGHVEFLLVRLGDGTYAFETGYVAHLAAAPAVTRVPRTPPAIRGVTSVGGDVVAVIDSRALFGIEVDAESTPRLVVLTASAGPSGLLVDGIDHIEAYPVDRIVPPSVPDDWTPAVGRDRLKAVIDRAPGETDGERIGVLDPDRVVRAAAVE